MAERVDRSEVSLVTKYLLFFINCVFFLVGIASAAAGSYVLILKDKTVQSAFDFFSDPTILLCIGGSIIVFVSFFGIVGSLRENTCCITVYYGLIMFFLLGQVVLIVIIFLFYYVPTARDFLGLNPENALKEAIEKYRDDEDRQNFIDWWQVEFKCCGVSNDAEGYKDWGANIYFNCTERSDGIKSPESCSVPWSCCRLEAGSTLDYQCGGNVVGDKSSTVKIYTQGCLKGMAVWLDANALIFGGVLIGVLLPQAVFVYMAKNFLVQIEAQKAKWQR